MRRGVGGVQRCNIRAARKGSLARSARAWERLASKMSLRPAERTHGPAARAAATGERLHRVLAVGAHHRGARTGGPAMDEALGTAEIVTSILRAIDARDDGEIEDACTLAATWCNLNSDLRNACKGDPNAWKELTTRVFGDDVQPVNESLNAEANFYALCMRARALRWLARNDLFRRADFPHQADAIAEIMTHINNGGKKTPEGRAQLAVMLMYVLDDDEYLGQYHKFREFAEPAWLYENLLGGTDDEKTEYLELLTYYAFNRIDGAEDNRFGYNEEHIPTLQRVLLSGDGWRAGRVLRLWHNLLHAPEPGSRVGGAVKRYVSSMVAHGVNEQLSSLIRRRLDGEGRRYAEDLSASVLSDMVEALNTHSHQ